MTYTELDSLDVIVVLDIGQASPWEAEVLSLVAATLLVKHSSSHCSEERYRRRNKAKLRSTISSNKIWQLLCRFLWLMSTADTRQRTGYANRKTQKPTYKRDGLQILWVELFYMLMENLNHKMKRFDEIDMNDWLWRQTLCKEVLRCPPAFAVHCNCNERNVFTTLKSNVYAKIEGLVLTVGTKKHFNSGLLFLFIAMRSVCMFFSY